MIPRDVRRRRAVAVALAAAALLLAGCGSGSVFHAGRVVQTVGPTYEATGVVVAFRGDGAALEVAPSRGLTLVTERGSRRLGRLPAAADPWSVSAAIGSDDTIYFASDALYASADGRTWRATKREPANHALGPIAISGHLVYAMRTRYTNDGCGSCDIGPDPFGLYVSADSGASWRRVAKYVANEIWGVFPAGHAAAAGSVFVATSNGLYLHRPGRPDVERDGGVQRSYDYPPSVALFGVSGEATPELYLVDAEGESGISIQLYASDDAGRHWHLRRSPFHRNSGALVGDPSRPRVAYAVVENPATAPRHARGYRSTIYATHDAANSWRPVWRGCLRTSRYALVPVAAGPGPERTLVLQTCDGRLHRVQVA